MRPIPVWMCLPAVTLLLCGCQDPPAASISDRPETDLYSRRRIASIMRTVFAYHRDHPTLYRRRGRKQARPAPGNDWQRATFWAGVMAAHRATDDPDYLAATLDWAQRHRWQPHGRRKGNGQCAGATYLDLYAIYGHRHMIEPIGKDIDAMVADPRPGREEWHWVDALFMAPPTMARLAAATGRAEYRDLMHRMWWDTTDYLFDPQAGLYYRDARYFKPHRRTGRPRRTASGRKILWSRGNGWAIAGLVRVLEVLPDDDPYRPRYERLLRTMAAALADCQQDDGLWRTNLADAGQFPSPETSGSGFFCYAIAWAVRNGLLDRQVYLPVARRAWKGLVGCLLPGGGVGYAQPDHYQPGPVKPEGTRDFAAGAFLLAAAEMYLLAEQQARTGP